MTEATGTEKTRLLLLEALRVAPASADELAQPLGLTTNAVRFHLGSLEKDGLVKVAGTRKPAGAGKPAVLYVVSDDADVAFSKAYAPILAACIQELRSSVSEDEVIPFLRRVGDRLAAESDTAKPLSRRVRAASDTLNALGGLTTVSRTAEGYEIRGSACPLAAVVTKESCACTVVESLVEKIVGAPVTEQCDRSGRPKCCFEVKAAE